MGTKLDVVVNDDNLCFGGLLNCMGTKPILVLGLLATALEVY